MNLKNLFACLIITVALVVNVGCEWTSSGSDNSWTDAYNWVNFSGTYKAIAGGVLVSDYSTTSSTGDGSSITGEVIATGTVNNSGEAESKYTGTLANSGIVPGTLVIEAGTVTFRDDSNGGLTGGSDGSINYTTGAWSIDTGAAPPNEGTQIIASYSYTVSGSGDGAGSGTTGAAIYSFVVWQNGEHLELTDNNGSVYKGSMGSLSGSVNTPGSNTATDGESVAGQFNVSGTSAAGYEVNIAGNFQGVVSGTAPDQYLTSRYMFGTWIETNGKTGDISGGAAPISISTSVTNATTSTSTDTTTE